MMSMMGLTFLKGSFCGMVFLAYVHLLSMISSTVSNIWYPCMASFRMAILWMNVEWFCFVMFLGETVCLPTYGRTIMIALHVFISLKVSIPKKKCRLLHFVLLVMPKFGSE